MSGYVTKGNHIYNGDYLAGEALKNGLFAEIVAAGTVKKITAAGDMELRVDAKETLFGEPAIRATVVYEGTKDTFFVENEWDLDCECNYNTADYELPAGEYVKMKRLLAGEQVIFNVTSAVAATLAVNDIIKPASGGSVAKKS